MQGQMVELKLHFLRERERERERERKFKKKLTSLITSFREGQTYPSFTSIASTKAEIPQY